MANQIEFEKTVAEFQKIEDARDQLWDRAKVLIDSGFEVEAYILILATWNFAGFRYVMKDFDLREFQKVINLINPIFKKLENTQFENIDFANNSVAPDIKYIYVQLKKIAKQTGASKIMALKNSRLFVMWDTEIRKIYEIDNKSEADDYIQFLSKMQKTDMPGTFNAGATLGPVNPVRSKTSKMSADVQAHRTSNGVNETNMARIWNHSTGSTKLTTSKLMTGKHKTITPLKRKVFVGVSGGVDSSVAAALLKKQEFDVTGVFIKIWNPKWGQCEEKDERISAMRVCAVLDIPFREIDLSKEYEKDVVSNMVAEYQVGRTPNPDVLCNRKIKFGRFFDWAIKNGADYIATGHYAKIIVGNTSF